MRNLLLQKPARNSKSKDHLEALNRRLNLWKEGEVTELLIESETIQKSLRDSESIKAIAELSKKSKKHMKKGKINAAVIFLTNNMHDGILPLNNETLNKLKEKHPKSKNANNVLLTGVQQDVHLIMLAGIDEEMTRKAAFDGEKEDRDLRQRMQMDVEGFYVQITLVMQT